MSAQDRIRSLRLSMRFIAPLVVTLAVLGYALLPVVDRLTLRWWVNDLDTRSQLVANTLEDQLAQLVQQGATAKINTLFNRALQDQRLYAEPRVVEQAYEANRWQPVQDQRYKQDEHGAQPEVGNAQTQQG